MNPTTTWCARSLTCGCACHRTTDISARYPTRDGGENGSSTGADLDAVRVVVTA